MSDQATEQGTVNKLTVLAANIEGHRVLIPDAMIAEIVDFQPTVTETDDVPTWYLGKLPWREITVPLISLEAMNTGSFFSKNRTLKIIVLHTASQRKNMPYWALVVHETPRMMRLVSGDISRMETDESGDVEAMRAELAGEEFIIPDVEKIENNISGMLG